MHFCCVSNRPVLFLRHTPLYSWCICMLFALYLQDGCTPGMLHLCRIHVVYVGTCVVFYTVSAVHLYPNCIRTRITLPSYHTCVAPVLHICRFVRIFVHLYCGLYRVCTMLVLCLHCICSALAMPLDCIWTLLTPCPYHTCTALAWIALISYCVASVYLTWRSPVLHF